MVKWRLFLKTLPWVAGVVVLALLRDTVFQFQGFLAFGDISPLLPAVALIMGFMLAGVLADYKESEKIPGEIANTLETISDTIQVVAALHTDTEMSRLETKYSALVVTVDDCFLKRASVDGCYAALEDFRENVTDLHTAGGPLYSIRCLTEIHNLRRLITRADVISRTAFIPVGYTLLELLVGVTLILMLASSYTTPLAEYFLIALFSMVYIYLLFLIRDMDDPFDYDPQKDIRESAEVDPYPLREYRQRLEEHQN